MYGVPADLNLAPFLRATLTQIALGEFQIQFRFDPEGTISVEGKWELRASNGSIVDEFSRTDFSRDAYRVHVILGKQVIHTQVDAPDSFSLHFATGHLLTIWDDSQQYESFSIQPGNVFV